MDDPDHYQSPQFCFTVANTLQSFCRCNACREIAALLQMAVCARRRGMKAEWVRASARDIANTVPSQYSMNRDHLDEYYGRY